MRRLARKAAVWATRAGSLRWATMRDGREEGRVGFDEDAICGSEGCGIANGGRSRVGKVSGEGEIEAEVERAAGVVEIAGEAVHDAGDAVGVPMLGDKAQEVFFGVGCAVLFPGGGCGEFTGAAVDQYGLAGDGGKLHLGDEGGLLGGDVGVVDVVVVEADLAEGDAFFLCDQGREFGEVFGRGLVGFLRVDAGAGVDVGVLVGDLKGAVHGGGAVAYSDGQQAGDAGGFGIG